MNDAIMRRLENRRILILGLGREGQSTLNFIHNHHIPCSLTVADKKAPGHELRLELQKRGIHCVFGPEYLDLPDEFELIIKSPGIPSQLITGQLSAPISSQTDLFLEAYGRQTIGITGTKGKSTTSSLIHHILSKNGQHALLTGNIGIPCFDIIPEIGRETTVVFELSAHQLEFVRHSPHIGLLLNIFPEHLDHFGDFERYAAAKCNIFAHMQHDDVLIVHSDLSQRIPSQLASVRHYYDQVAINHTAIPLKGKHFDLLAKAALLATSAAGVDSSAALAALHSFDPLPHRLEPIGPIDGVLFINDSIATIPEATLAALDTWPPTFLILGGFDRGIDYGLIVEGLKRHDTTRLLLTGPAGQRMGQLIEAAYPNKPVFYFNQLEEAFGLIAQVAREGDVVMLSPAAASYDQYLNFEHRGNRFKELALNFKRQNPIV